MGYTLLAFGFRAGLIKLIEVFSAAGSSSYIWHYIPFLRQSDPSSLLLFMLFVEPLAVSIRADFAVKGVLAGGQ